MSIDTNSVLIQVTSSKWSGESTIAPEFEGDKANAADVEKHRKKKRMVKVTKRLMDPKLLGGPSKEFGKFYNFIKRKSLPTQFRGLFRVPKDETLLQTIVDKYNEYKEKYTKEIELLEAKWDSLIGQAETDFAVLNEKALKDGYLIEFDSSEYPEFISDEYNMSLQMVSIVAPDGLPEAIQSVQTTSFHKLTEDAAYACKETLRQRFAEAANLLMEKLVDPEKLKDAKSASLENLKELIQDFEAMNMICDDAELKALSEQCAEALKIIPTIKSLKESQDLKTKFQNVFGSLAKSIGDLVSNTFKKSRNLRHI
tara:strand:- start:8106 stop:9041 length:936 start_codon:yes stop_codon:yes gene_type:complete